MTIPAEYPPSKDLKPSSSGNRQAVLPWLARLSLGTGVFFSGFVLFEPGPYEILMLALMSLWLLSGLRLSIHALTLLLLFTLFNIGGVLSIFQMDDLKKAPLYIAVSYFLALTAVFFAAVTESDWRRLQPLFTGYLAAAIITGLLGIAGYLNLIPAADLFTLYGRAKGAFQDPNVFGPFSDPAGQLVYLSGIDPPLPKKPALLGAIFDIDARHFAFFLPRGMGNVCHIAPVYSGTAVHPQYKPTPAR